MGPYGPQRGPLYGPIFLLMSRMCEVKNDAVGVWNVLSDLEISLLDVTYSLTSKLRPSSIKPFNTLWTSYVLML